MKNYKDYVASLLKKFKKEDIIFTDHTEIRLIRRQIDKEEVIENIINPEKLDYAIKEEAEYSSEEKFDCYFGYSKSLCHRYVLVIKHKIIVVTVVKIKRRWQIIAEKKLKKPKR